MLLLFAHVPSIIKTFNTISKVFLDNRHDLLKRCEGASNKAGYTAQDAPSMRSFHLRKYHGTYGRTDRRTDRRTDGPTDRRTDTTSYRDATAHLKTGIICLCTRRQLERNQSHCQAIAKIGSTNWQEMPWEPFTLNTIFLLKAKKR